MHIVFKKPKQFHHANVIGGYPKGESPPYRYLLPGYPSSPPRQRLGYLPTFTTESIENKLKQPNIRVHRQARLVKKILIGKKAVKDNTLKRILATQLSTWLNLYSRVKIQTTLLIFLHP